MKIFVVGAGQMGARVAKNFLRHGHEVWINDSVEAAVQSGVNKVRHLLKASLFGGKEYDAEQTPIQPDEIENHMQRLHAVTDYLACTECDLVVETIFEDFSLKRELYFNLDELCHPETILVTNTATFSISELALGLDHAENFCGMHFFTVQNGDRLIEIIPGAQTSQKVVDKLCEISRSIEKEPIVCEDSPGFIVNRLFLATVNDACNMMMEGVADAEAIDKAMRLSSRATYGPLQMADFMGTDTVLLLLENIHAATADSRYRPSPYLRKMVRKNCLGKKVGKGFFTYD